MTTKSQTESSMTHFHAFFSLFFCNCVEYSTSQCCRVCWISMLKETWISLCVTQLPLYQYKFNMSLYTTFLWHKAHAVCSKSASKVSFFKHNPAKNKEEFHKHIWDHDLPLTGCIHRTMWKRQSCSIRGAIKHFPDGPAVHGKKNGFKMCNSGADDDQMMQL